MNKFILHLILLFAILVPSYAAVTESDVAVGFSIDDAEEIRIGFASEPVNDIDQAAKDINGSYVNLVPSFESLTAILTEPVYMYAQILYAENCSVSVSASPMSGTGEMLGWNIGTSDDVWLSVNESDPEMSHVVWEHDGSDISSVHSVPLAIETESFEGKTSSHFDGVLTVLVSSDLSGGTL